MAMTRVWNISDDVLNQDVKPQNVVVLGSFLKPGRFVAVDEADLVRAHKVHKSVKDGVLYIGKRPPAAYFRMKNPARAKLADGVIKAHAPVLEAPKAPAPKAEPKVEVPPEAGLFGKKKKRKGE